MSLCIQCDTLYMFSHMCFWIDFTGIGGKKSCAPVLLRRAGIWILALTRTLLAGCFLLSLFLHCYFLLLFYSPVLKIYHLRSVRKLPFPPSLLFPFSIEKNRALHLRVWLATSISPWSMSKLLQLQEPFQEKLYSSTSSQKPLFSWSLF